MNLNHPEPKEDDEWLSGVLHYSFGIVACILFGVFCYSLSFVFPFPVSSLESDLYYLEKVTDIIHINSNDPRQIYKWVPVKKSTVKLMATKPYSDLVQNLRLGLFFSGFILAIPLCWFFKWVCFFRLLNQFPSLRSHHKWMVILLITSLCDIIERSGSITLTFIISSFIAFIVTFIATTLKSDSTGLTDGALMGFTKLAIVFGFGQNRDGVFYSICVVICAVCAKLREIKATAAIIKKATASAEKASGAAASESQSPPVVDEERKTI